MGSNLFADLDLKGSVNVIRTVVCDRGEDDELKAVVLKITIVVTSKW